jgi:hypothetical protein
VPRVQVGAEGTRTPPSTFRTPGSEWKPGAATCPMARDVSRRVEPDVSL